MEHIDLSRIRLGMTREEVVAVCGDTDLKGATSRKYPTPSVYRYGRVEFLFEPWKSGGLLYVQEVDEVGDHVRNLIHPKTR